MKQIFSALIFIFSGSLALAAIPEDVDSTLYMHYQRCSNHVRERVIFEMADSLYDLSGQKGDKRMQAAALTFKADYYYFNNDLDSFRLWVPRIEEFARQNDQLKYYYFSWNRIILYYTKHSQYTLAQYELERLLEQAAKDNYTPAYGQAYMQLGHIYYMKRLYKLSTEYYRKAIEQEQQDENKDKHSNISPYVQLSGALFNLGELDESLQVLETAKTHVTHPAQLDRIKVREVRVLCAKGEVEKAEELLNEVMQSPYKDISGNDLAQVRSSIYTKKGMYTKALEIFNEQEKTYNDLNNSEESYAELFGNRATVYALMGNYKKAYEDITHFMALYNTRVASENEQTLSEFATLFDVAKLDREVAEAQQLVQHERLHRTQVMIVSLCGILILLVCFIVFVSIMNRRLARAKRAAEETSRMKSNFIRHVTHEINTPLNAILGFAELAATTALDDAERKEYIDIIRENSTMLIRMIDNTLYISDVESLEKEPETTPIEINQYCKQVIESVESICQPGVEIVFSPAREQLTIHTAQWMLAKALREMMYNALTFTTKGSVTLAYTIADDQRSMSFTVTDTGIGIPDEKTEEVFDRFSKLDTFSQGMGLGLSACRLIAHRLGGEAKVDKTYRNGTRIVFTIAIKID